MFATNFSQHAFTLLDLTGGPQKRELRDSTTSFDAYCVPFLLPDASIFLRKIFNLEENTFLRFFLVCALAMDLTKIV